MESVSKVLIVGSGIAGQTLACALARRSIACDLIEVKSKFEIAGAGMYVQGNALKALADIDVVDAVLRAGSYSENDESIFADSDGNELARVRYPRIAGPDIPAMVPIRREALHDVLAAAVAAHGVPLRLGLTVDAIENGNGSVKVRFSDGSTGVYRLVVGADGIRSRVRELVFDRLEPVYTGFANWRVILPRPAGFRNVVWMNGPGKTLGVIPIARDAVYIAGVTKEPGNPYFERPHLVELMQRRFAGFGGMARDLMAQVVDPAQIVYTPIEEVHLPAPWYRGHTIVIGDAAHAGTPFWAQGAAMAIEDAVLLARLLAERKSVTSALESWMNRRYKRCKFVQQGSLQSGERSHSEEPGAGERLRAYTRTRMQSDVDARYAALAEDY